MTSFEIAMIGPDRLRDGFSVLLGSAQHVNSLLYTTNLDDLYTLTADLSPDLIIVHVVHGQEVCKAGQIPIDDLSGVRAGWPEVTVVALVDDLRLMAEMDDQGIDLVLLEGVSPTRFLQEIERLLADRQSSQTQSAAN